MRPHRTQPHLWTDLGAVIIIDFVHFPGMRTKDRYFYNFLYSLMGKEPKNHYNSAASQILENFEKMEYHNTKSIAIVFWIMIALIISIIIIFLFIK